MIDWLIVNFSSGNRPQKYLAAKLFPSSYDKNQLWILEIYLSYTIMN